MSISQTVLYCIRIVLELDLFAYLFVLFGIIIHLEIYR